ncbi:thioredoxin [bacterium]|nr:thioredoxin [bacterium]
MSTACGGSSASAKESISSSNSESTKLIEVTDSDFQSLLKSTDKPILVDFWAPWCSPCRKLGPMIEELSKDYSEKALIAKMNVDKNKNTPGQYKIRGIPAVLVFKNGELKAQIIGLKKKSVYKEAIDSLL